MGDVYNSVDLQHVTYSKYLSFPKHVLLQSGYAIWNRLGGTH